MRTVGIVSPGAMGSAVGAAYAHAGARAVATVAGRSERTRALAEKAGLELLDDLDAVVAASDVVLSIVPPAEARAVATEIGAAARRTGATPLVADLNAVSPATARRIDSMLADADLELVDGSISGGPPREDYRTRVYLSGPRAAELAATAPPWLDARPLGEEIGTASAVKMSTASVYKGNAAVLAHALLAAHANGVLEPVLDDLRDSFPREIERAARSLAVTATKADRFVGEMREIAAAQGAAGLPDSLFAAMAEVYAALARTPAAAAAPESVSREPELEDVLDRLRNAGERT